MSSFLYLPNHFYNTYFFFMPYLWCKVSEIVKKVEQIMWLYQARFNRWLDQKIVIRYPCIKITFCFTIIVL